jgi:hypothetical protein
MVVVRGSVGSPRRHEEANRQVGAVSPRVAGPPARPHGPDPSPGIPADDSSRSPYTPNDERVPEREGNPDFARNLVRHAIHLRLSRDLTGARLMMERAVPLLEAEPEVGATERAAALNDLGALTASLGELAAARCLFERSLRSCREADAIDRHLEGSILANLRRSGAAGLKPLGGVAYA